MSKVLIVEDAGDCLLPLKKLLQRDGHQVECAANGREALTVAERFVPDKVVTDLMMPEMDGVSFIRALRQDPRFSAVPVVVFTALVHDRIQKQLLISVWIKRARAQPDAVAYPVGACDGVQTRCSWSSNGSTRHG